MMKKKAKNKRDAIRRAWADRNTTTVVASTFPQWVPYPSPLGEETITVVEVVHDLPALRKGWRPVASVPTKRR